MNARVAVSPEVQSLIEAVCDGMANDAQLLELQSILLSDEAARTYYVDLLNLDAELQWHIASLCKGELALDEFIAAKQTTLPPPAPGIVSTIFQGTIGFFSQEVPFACLVATAFMGIALAICSQLYVTHYDQYARTFGTLDVTSPSPSSHAPRPSSVARITGMVDVEWGSGAGGQGSGVENPEIPKSPNPESRVPHPQSHAPRPSPLAPVSVGDRFELSSGLVQLTYNTGAQVILQGPCTYEVNSPAGGFLSLGKLTARVNSGQQTVDSAKPQASDIHHSSFSTHHSPPPSPLAPHPSPLFTVKTPTATITDLGTEFGVEVDNRLAHHVHVFQGRVQIQPTGRQSECSEPIILNAGQTAHLSYEGQTIHSSTDKASATTVRFVRHLPRTAKPIDILDIIAGGDGKGQRRGSGINPTNATGETVFRSITYHRSDKFLPVTSNPFIDGVFIIAGGEPVQLDSAGNLYDGFRSVEGATIGSIWARDADCRPDGQSQKRWHWFCAIGGAVKYMPSGRGLLCLHPNVGITLNLAEIRTTRQDGIPLRFHTIAGMAGPGMADLTVFVDGQMKFQQLRLRNETGPIHVSVLLQPTDRFLTLAATDGGNGIDYDWLVLGDPVIQLSPQTEQSL